MLKDQVVHWIDENEDSIIEFLQTILRIPSVTGNETEIQDFLSDYLSNDMGLIVDKFVPSLEELRNHPAYVPVSQCYENRPNVVSILKGTGEGRSLLLNGHIDVIPEGSPENWKHGCWSADIENGRIYGRGASDMKSGIASMTMALKAIKACGIQLKGDVISEYVMDEELSGNGTLACVIKGYKADAGICCETSSMHVQPGSIGRIWFEIKVKGKAAGIQHRYEGINAIDLGYLVMNAVTKFENLRISRVTHPLYPNILSAIPCMVGQFESGTYPSAFPDTCLLKGSMATVPGENSDKVKIEFVEFLREEVTKMNPWFKENPPEIKFVGYFAEPSEIPVDSPIVNVICKSYKDIIGEKPIVSGREGAADIRHLIKYGNTPTVIFGPGLTEQMHANNEWVKIEDYLNATKILSYSIMDWCGIKE